MKFFISVLSIAILVIMSGCSKFPDLGDGYKLYTDGKYTLAIINFQNTLIIKETILEYAFDTTFILVSQRPWDSIPNIRTMNYKKSNEAFEKSTFLQYWIINKKLKSEFSMDKLSKRTRYSNVYGPFKKEEFLRKKEELRVPKELILKDE